MKLKNSFLSLGLALAAMGGMSGIAHADLLAYYNFNDGQASQSPANATTLAPSSSSNSSASSISTTFTTPAPLVFGGTTLNAANGSVAGNALAIQGGTAAAPATAAGTGGNNSGSFQFSFSAAGQTNIGLSYATQATATGFKTQTIDYSLDNGTTFTNFFTNTGIPTNFAVVNTGPIVALDNANSVTFRFTLTGATANTGNNRFDNIQANSNVAPVPEPSTIALFVIGLGGMAFAVRRKKSAEDTEAAGSALLPC